MRTSALALASVLVLGAISAPAAGASAAQITLLMLPPVSGRQPLASGIQGEAQLPGLGGFDVDAFARVVASLTNGFSLGVPGRPASVVDANYHFLQVGVRFSRNYLGRFDLYVGGGYAWEHASYHTDNFAGYGTAASGAAEANGPTAEMGIRVPLGRVADVRAGVMALFSQPTGQLCDTLGHCAAPDTRSILTYPYLGLGIHI